VATEFVGTSITTGGDVKPTKGEEKLLARNPFVRFYNRHRGYVRSILTPKTYQSDYVMFDVVSKPNAPALPVKSFVVESGRPGAKPI
jgi:alkaline phosphatase D